MKSCVCWRLLIRAIRVLKRKYRCDTTVKASRHLRCTNHFLCLISCGIPHYPTILSRCYVRQPVKVVISWVFMSCDVKSSTFQC